MPKGVYPHTSPKLLESLVRARSKLTPEVRKRAGVNISKAKLGKSRPDMLGNQHTKGRKNPHSVVHCKNISRGKQGNSSPAIIRANREHWLDPTYRAKVERHVGIGRKGYYSSKKNRCQVFYRSSYELAAYLKLEQDPHVIRYGICHFSLPYLIDGGAHLYIPDILVELTGERTLVLEIKARWQSEIPEISRLIIAKKLAAEEFCRKIGAEYQIWTEEQLF